MKRILLIILALSFVLTPYAQKTAQRKKTATTARTVRTQKKTPKKKPVKRRQSKAPTRAEKKAAYINASIRGLQGQRANIQKKIKEQEKALRRNQADVKKRLQDLMVLNGEIDQRQKNIDGIQQDIHHIDGNIGLLNAQLKILEQQLQDRKNKYIRSMRYMTRHHSVQDKLMFIFSAKNLTQMYRRLSFIRQYSAYQKAQGEAVKAKQKQVTEKHKQLQVVKGHKNNLLYKGQQEKTALEGKQTEQQQVVQGLQKQQKTIQAVIADQRKKDAAINAQIDRLIAIEVEKARARAAAEAKRKAEAQAAAQRRREELARRKAQAEAEARENARRIEEARRKEREAELARQRAAEENRKAQELARKAQEEARLQAENSAKARAQDKARARAEKAAREAAEQANRQARAEQAAREAEADRRAAELKAKTDEARNRKELASARREANDAATLSTVDRMLSGGFEANRGRLPMPITGTFKIVSHFGQYNVQGLSGVTLDNKGINLLGKPGCVARSIYDGEVSAVFGYGGMWNVLVRHGAYISVYCNLKSVSVHKGQKVSTRQALGAVGADNILQFQLRKETAKLNPEAWLAR
ncbi:MAG: peptidoglycan DD-metalloendopeptidase family protein [Prevotella copri]|nr:peptidoglycan DD-metalloendopeptidase family protein [Segatella copri]